MPAWLAVERSKDVILLNLYDSFNDMKYFQNCLHHTSSVPQPIYLLIGANLAQAVFLGKMELMVCSDLVGGTTEQSCLFPDLICYYKLYEILLICLHYTSAVPQAFLLLIGVNLVLAVFLG